ncbi:hypothetical protein E3P99_02788 [Wallemia hederae]|uniref:RGS domain-containing protein n=1 Tax=Wallemia hederae TaxID=1540922 RepID=A0A4T0FJB9_9BASI|nr:hypothetical protein E3P99_02788 [Wallemia hederae]
MRTGNNVQTLSKLMEDKELAEEFRKFLEYQQHSIENLNFILWYKAYKKKFSGLSGQEQDKSPTCKPSKKRKKLSTSASNSISAQPQNQPFRQEVEEVISVYFNKLSQFELNLPEEIQSYTLDQLRSSTHPDCFLKAYEHVHYLIQSSSIPEFMACKYPQPTKTPSRLRNFFKSL